MRRLFIILLALFMGFSSFADSLPSKKVYVFPIREAIMPSVIKLTDKCMSAAQELGADYIVIDINTYGGLVDAADSVRTRILNSRIPVIAFINNQAASAGALISIAADTIFMREGASIGAATVVGESGQAMPDKYQSFMRSMMRATAEAHGKVAVVKGSDTTWRWFRDPNIAQAMVDPTVMIPGLIDSTKVLTFTTNEAIAHNFCEGRASSVDEIMSKIGVEDYVITEYKPTSMDRLLGFLTNPAFQGIVIMLIIGGIYFELQTPGIGFPLVVAIAAAALYFAPLYLEGLVANWEVLLFVAGIVLILVEIFVTPGFGVIGILGIACVVLGLTFAMIDTDLLRYVPTGEISIGFIVNPFALVIVSVTAALIASIIVGRRILTGESHIGRRIVLSTEMKVSEGYVSRSTDSNLIGRQGVVTRVMHPTGKIEIDGTTYEAAAEDGLYIDKGEQIEVVSEQGGVLYCKKLSL